MRIHRGNAALEELTEDLGRSCLVALVGGALIGVIGAVFRAGIAWLEARHVETVLWAHNWPWLGWLIPVVLGALGAGIARLMIRPEPLSSGSGVQHVEAVMHGEVRLASLLVVPIKFIGGWLGIGAGLALGREGPTIQMGATIGAHLAKYFRCASDALKDLQAALGGAGLAVAFNAPVGGALFVFEEVARAFRLRLTIVVLLGTATAIGVCRAILGNTPDFNVPDLSPGPQWELVLYCLLGGVLGLLGVLYNRTTIFCLDAFEKAKSLPPEIRAAVVGAIVGLVAWFLPTFTGGGDALSQQVLGGGVPIGALLLILVVRWFLGPLSYSAGTPGGIFSPLLLVGAVLGAMFALGLNLILPESAAVSPVAFGIAGMAAFFTGVVRAPLTGAVLIVEMTATSGLMAPMLAASFGAMLSASLSGGEPIYDTLRKRMLAKMGVEKS